LNIQGLAVFRYSAAGSAAIRVQRELRPFQLETGKTYREVHRTVVADDRLLLERSLARCRSKPQLGSADVLHTSMSCGKHRHQSALAQLPPWPGPVLDIALEQDLVTGTDQIQRHRHRAGHKAVTRRR